VIEEVMRTMTTRVPVRGQRNVLGRVLEPLREVGGRIAELIRPASQASSSRDAYSIDVELPGVGHDDVEVEVVGGDTLVVRGEKRDRREEKGDGYIFTERAFGRFERAFELPADVDPDGISAEFADGVLTLSLPRKADSARRIDVKRG
jgi:HSP20 family protein